MALYASLHERDFVFCKEWDEARKQQFLQKWRMKDAMFLILAPLHTAVAALFVGLFLTAVTDRDRTVFLTTCLFTVIQAWLLKPIVVAAVLAQLVGMMDFEKSRMKYVEEKLGLSKDEIELMFNTSGVLPQHEAENNDNSNLDKYGLQGPGPTLTQSSTLNVDKLVKVQRGGSGGFFGCYCCQMDVAPKEELGSTTQIGGQTNSAEGGSNSTLGINVSSTASTAASATEELR